jgi:hypothetical protein
MRRVKLLLPAVLAGLLAAGTSPVPVAASPAAVVAAPGDVRRAAEPQVTSVLAISVDGLTPRALSRLGRKGTPHLHRLMRQGASTLNARTERELTLTLPNHTGMVTGRRIQASRGGHGVTWNDDRMTPPTVQAAAGGPVESVFTTLAAADRSAAVFASKTKFTLWQRSWPDAIDRMVVRENNPRLVDALVDDLSKPHDLRFLHLSLPDVVGHAKGWMSPAYLRAVRRADMLVGRAVDAATSDPALAATTAVILTADHGGAGRTHGAADRLTSYRVPFMVRGPGIPRGADLYALNPDYRDPGTRRTTYAAARQPVRNGMVANLALDLLGLGPVPDSEHNLAQDLDVS